MVTRHRKSMAVRATASLLTVLAIGCAPTDAARLPYAAFLPLQPDDPARRAYYRAFQQAQTAIDRLLPERRRRRPKLIRATGVARWHASGLIEIPSANVDDIGVVYHETFHGAFHGSPLDQGSNQRWGEGFCDAFRYFMEERHFSSRPTPWLLRARRLADPALSSASDLVTRRYVLPMVLIVNHVRADYSAFQSWWRQLHRRAPDLSKLLAYSPP